MPGVRKFNEVFVALKQYEQHICIIRDFLASYKRVFGWG